MGEALVELERVQTQLLQRISKLEHSYIPSSPSQNDTVDDAVTDTVARLSSILRSNGVPEFSFKRVPSDYYDWPLEARRDALSAASIHHLCKSIVLVNTQAPANVVDCTNRNNSKYYVVVVQVPTLFLSLPASLNSPTACLWRSFVSVHGSFQRRSCQEFSVFAQQWKYCEEEIQQ